MIGYFWIMVFVSLFTSCNRQTVEDNDKWMDRAGRLLQEHPDSALIFLDSITVELLDKSQYADYTLLSLQAKDQLAMDISGDTAILSVKDRFVRQNDPEKAAKAFFYAAKVLESGDNGFRAMELYLAALQYAGCMDNDILKGRIQNRVGYLNFDRRWYGEALRWYRSALESYRLAGARPEKEVQVLIAIGNVFLRKNQTDSAKHYYGKALVQSQGSCNTGLQAVACKNIGLLYSRLEHNMRAKDYLEKAASMVNREDDKTKAQIFMMLSDVYNRTDLADSAKYYLDLAQALLREYNDLDLSAGLSGFFYLIEKKQGNFAKALEYQEQYIHQLMAVGRKNDHQELLELQKKYDMETVKYEHQKAVIRWLTVTLILSVFLFVLVIIFYFVRRKNIRNRQALEKAEEKLTYFQGICGSYAKKENVWQAAFLDKIGIMREVVELDKYVRKDRKNDHALILKIDEIISKLHLQTFMQAMDELRPGSIDNLKNRFPQLDEQDVCVCCLCCLDFKNEGISVLMSKKINTIQQKKTEIRRKIGIPHHGNIKEFLMNNRTEPD